MSAAAVAAAIKALELQALSNAAEYDIALETALHHGADGGDTASAPAGITASTLKAVLTAVQSLTCSDDGDLWGVLQTEGVAGDFQAMTVALARCMSGGQTGDVAVLAARVYMACCGTAGAAAHGTFRADLFAAGLKVLTAGASGALATMVKAPRGAQERKGDDHSDDGDELDDDGDLDMGVPDGGLVSVAALAGLTALVGLHCLALNLLAPLLQPPLFDSWVAAAQHQLALLVEG